MTQEARRVQGRPGGRPACRSPRLGHSSQPGRPSGGSPGRPL